MIPASLSSREIDVCKLIVTNPSKGYKELSYSIGISENTFSVHTVNIFKKLNVNSRQELYDKFITYSFDSDGLILQRLTDSLNSLETELKFIRSLINSLVRESNANKIGQAV